MSDSKKKWAAARFEYVKYWPSEDPCDVKQVDEEDLVYLCKCANEIEAHNDKRRERFAMAAMQGLCANNFPLSIFDEGLAKYAVQYADALIAELDKEKP